MTRRTASLLIPGMLGAAAFAQEQPEPWRSSDVIQPETLAARIKGAGTKPMILYVGFPVLYRSTRITGAVLAGPGDKPKGLALLKQVVAKAPKNQEIVLYCGCCPWTQCPNVRPAFKTLREMGFTNVKLVEIPMNLSRDWVNKGYPTEKAASGPRS